MLAEALDRRVSWLLDRASPGNYMERCAVRALRRQLSRASCDPCTCAATTPLRDQSRRRSRQRYSLHRGVDDSARRLATDALGPIVIFSASLAPRCPRTTRPLDSAGHRKKIAGL